MRNLLIFCYFSLIFLGLSCAETKKKEVNTTTDDIEVSDSLQATTKKDKSILFFWRQLNSRYGHRY